MSTRQLADSLVPTRPPHRSFVFPQMVDLLPAYRRLVYGYPRPIVRLRDSLFAVRDYRLLQNDGMTKPGILHTYAHVTFSTYEFSDSVHDLYICDCLEMERARNLLVSCKGITMDALLQCGSYTPCLHVRLLESAVTAGKQIDEPVQQRGPITLLRADDKLNVLSLDYKAVTAGIDTEFCVNLTISNGKLACCHPACAKSKKRKSCVHREEFKMQSTLHDFDAVLGLNQEEPPVSAHTPEESTQSYDFGPKISVDVRPPNLQPPPLETVGDAAATAADAPRLFCVTESWQVDVDDPPTVGVFRFSDKIWFTHKLIVTYMHLMRAGKGFTFTAMYEFLESNYRLSSSSLCHRSTFIDAMQLAMAHMDLDYESLFSCPCCSKILESGGALPGVVLDGTAIGFPRHLMDEETKRRRVEQYDVAGDAVPLDTSRFTYGGGQNAQTIRSLLKEYATKEPVMKAEDKKRLLALLQKESSAFPGLHAFILDIWDAPTLRKDAAHLLVNLATPYPVRGYIHGGIMEPGGAFDRILQTHEGYLIDCDTRTQLADCSPCLNDVLRTLTYLPGAWKPLFQELAMRARLPFDITDRMLVSLPQRDDSEPLAEDPYVCMPNFPKVRKSSWPRDASSKTHMGCTKNELQHHHFTPGMFIVSCIHSVVLGFYAMTEFESVETAFRILLERFLHPPRYVIYDNACNLESFCMRREPYHFRNTVFWIDRMHFKNHSNCGHIYDMDAYPKCLMLDQYEKLTLEVVNSQIVEQINSRLQSVSTSLSFMKQKHYIQCAKNTFALMNKRRLEKMK